MVNFIDFFFPEIKLKLIFLKF